LLFDGLPNHFPETLGDGHAQIPRCHLARGHHVVSGNQFIY
jgi:hypothetical protein